MISQIIRDFESQHLKTDLPEFRAGDTIRVSVKIIEGDKERLQDFEGVVIRRRGSGIAETMTIRRVSYGVGMERILPLHSPKVDKIMVVRRGKVRRAKLYYLRDLRGKAARITEIKETPAQKAAAAEASKAAKAAKSAAKREAAAAKAAPMAAAAPAAEAPAAPEATNEEHVVGVTH